MILCQSNFHGNTFVPNTLTLKKIIIIAHICLCSQVCLVRLIHSGRKCQCIISSLSLFINFVVVYHSWYFREPQDFKFKELIFTFVMISSFEFYEVLNFTTGFSERKHHLLNFTPIHWILEVPHPKLL